MKILTVLSVGFAFLSGLIKVAGSDDHSLGKLRRWLHQVHSANHGSRLRSKVLGEFAHCELMLKRNEVFVRRRQLPGRK
jgi:hypothetical protein